MKMKVKTIRQHMNLTQKEFAERFHVSLRTLQSWEQERNDPPEYFLSMLNEINILSNKTQCKLNKINASLYCDDFDVFRSNVCHFLRQEGDISFIKQILINKTIDQFYEQNLIAYSLYMIAILDYISKENNISLCDNYNNLRMIKMNKIIMPSSLHFIKELYGETSKIFQTYKEQAIPEFLKYNIMESDIRNVV